MPKRIAETQITKDSPDELSADESSPLAARWWAWSPEQRQQVLRDLVSKISTPSGSEQQLQQWQAELDAYRGMESQPPAAKKATAAMMASRKVAPMRGRRGTPGAYRAPLSPAALGANPFGVVDAHSTPAQSFTGANGQPQQNTLFGMGSAQPLGNATSATPATSSSFAFGAQAGNANGGFTFGGGSSGAFNFSAGGNNTFSNPFANTNGAVQSPAAQPQISFGATSSTQNNGQNGGVQLGFGQSPATSSQAGVFGGFTYGQASGPASEAQSGSPGVSFTQPQHSIFGQSTQTSQSPSNPFGGTPQSQTSSMPQNSLFTQAAASQPNFMSNLTSQVNGNTSQPQVGSLFSSQSSSLPGSGNLFGAALQQSAQPEKGSLFAQQPTSGSPKDDMVAPKSTSQPPQSIIFANARPAADNVASIFATNWTSQPQAQLPSSTSVNNFGAGNKTSDPSNDTSSSKAFAAFSKFAGITSDSDSPVRGSASEDMSMHSASTASGPEVTEPTKATMPSNTSGNALASDAERTREESLKGIFAPDPLGIRKGNPFESFRNAPKPDPNYRFELPPSFGLPKPPATSQPETSQPQSTSLFSSPAPPAFQPDLSSMFPPAKKSATQGSHQTGTEQEDPADTAATTKASSTPFNPFSAVTDATKKSTFTPTTHQPTSSLSTFAQPAPLIGKAALQKPYSQLTQGDWDTLANDEKMTILNCALKSKLAQAQGGDDVSDIIKMYLGYEDRIKGADSIIASVLSTQTKSTGGKTTGKKTIAGKKPRAAVPASNFNPASTPLFQSPAKEITPANAPAPPTAFTPQASSQSSNIFGTVTTSGRKHGADEDISSTAKKSMSHKDDSTQRTLYEFPSSAASPAKRKADDDTAPSAKKQKEDNSLFSGPALSEAATPSKTSSQTSTLFKSLLDNQESVQTPPSASLFVNKPITDAAPSAVNMTSSTTPFSFTPTNAASPSLFSPKPATDAGSLFALGSSSNSQRADTSDSNGTPINGQNASRINATPSTTKSNRHFVGLSRASADASNAGAATIFGDATKGQRISSVKGKSPEDEGSTSKSANGGLVPPSSEGTSSVLDASRNASPAPSGGSIFDSPHLHPEIGGKDNIFGHLSDAESVSGSRKGDADDEAESDSEEHDDEDSENRPVEDFDTEGSKSVSEGEDGRNTTTNDTAAPPKKRKDGPFVDDDGSEGDSPTPPKRRRSFQHEASGTSTPASGRSLFERISYDKNSKAEKGLAADEEESTTPKTKPTSNPFGIPSTPNLGNSILKARNNGPAGDHTWKPDSPIKFGTSPGTTAPGAPGFNVTQATPSRTGTTENKENTDTTSRPLSNLFGAAATTNSSLFHPAPTAPDATGNPGFKSGLFGNLQPPGSSTLFPPSNGASLFSTPGASAMTSRATTPGMSGGESTAGEDEPQQPDPQCGDLLDVERDKQGHEVLFECAKAAAYLFEKKAWTKRGVGPLLVLKSDETGVSSILMKTDPGGRVVINTRVSAQGGYQVARPKQVSMIVPNQGTYNLRFSNAEDAERFVEACKT